MIYSVWQSNKNKTPARWEGPVGATGGDVPWNRLGSRTPNTAQIYHFTAEICTNRGIF